MSKFNMKVTPEIEKLTQICRENDKLDMSLYGKYDVKRGLRDLNGKGVLAGLTQISNVQATKIVDGKEVPCAGKLSYRGYDIKDLTNGFINDRRFGFEEVTYLLLFGKLPDQEELNGIFRDSCEPAYASTEFCKGCHYEGTIQRYYERSVKKRADALFLRQRPG